MITILGSTINVMGGDHSRIFTLILNKMFVHMSSQNHEERLMATALNLAFADHLTVLVVCFISYVREVGELGKVSVYSRHHIPSPS